MEDVKSTKEDPEIIVGDSSPWPYSNDYEIYIDGNTATITYYAMTSDPHIYIWRETLNLTQKANSYYVSSEEIKKYDSISTKKDLDEATYGNYDFYMSRGLSYDLNQNALENKTGGYSALFSPDTAASFLLNLSGGKCTVKKKYLTCTIVTYVFPDGESIDIRMIQPFGKKGIWQSNDYDNDEDKNKEKMERWYKKLSIRELNNVKTIVDENNLFEAEEGSTLLLAAVPADKVYLYGYSGGEAVILRINDKYQLFPWEYTSSRGILPKMGYADYDHDGIKEVAVALHTGTGTGYDVDKLYIVKMQKDGMLGSIEYTPYQYISQLNESISAVCDQKKKTLQFFIDNKKVGKEINISSWAEEEHAYAGISFGEQIAFEFSEKVVTLRTVPGCYFEDMFPSQYEEMPDFTTKVIYKEGEFSLTDIKIDEK